LIDLEIGKYIIFIGLFLILIGFIILLFHDKLNWFGNLYGDFKFEKNNFKFYFPFTSMVIISVFLSLLFSVLRKVFK